MRSGQLKHKISVYRLSTVRDEFLGYSEDYTLAFETRAEVRFLGGAEEVINSQIFPASDIQAYVRYRSEYVETMRIKFEDEMYDIDYIQQVGWRDGLKIKMSKISE